jgi:hypothetical protein
MDDRLSINNVDYYKRSDCRNYEPCLNAAIRSGWTQFHCRACRAFERAAPSSEELKWLTRLARTFNGGSA